MSLILTNYLTPFCLVCLSAVYHGTFKRKCSDFEEKSPYSFLNKISNPFYQSRELIWKPFCGSLLSDCNPFYTGISNFILNITLFPPPPTNGPNRAKNHHSLRVLVTKHRLNTLQGVSGKQNTVLESLIPSFLWLANINQKEILLFFLFNSNSEKK